MGPTLRSALLASALLSCAALPSRAEPVDLTAATCADFARMGENDRSQLALWLAGYYAGGAQRPHLDIDRIAAAPAALAALCDKAPQTPLVGAESRTVFIPPAP